MRRSRINPLSVKQRAWMKAWHEVVEERIRLIGCVCERCGITGQRTFPAAENFIEGHHIKKRRYHDDSPGNCMILCKSCHRWTETKPREYQEWLINYLERRLS